MWDVLEHGRFDRQLKRLPVDVLKRYETWKDIVSISGLQGLRLIKGFRDEALFGKYHGHRSSRLNRQSPVFYRIESDRIIVEVVNVIAHDCRRR